MILIENKKNDELLRCNVCGVEIDMLKVENHVKTTIHTKNKAKFNNELGKILTNHDDSKSSYKIWSISSLNFPDKK